MFKHYSKLVILGVFSMIIIAAGVTASAQQSGLAVPTGEQFEKNLSEEQMQAVLTAQDYLTSIKSLKATFVQYNPGDSSLANGTFYLSKPGKLRLEYEKPYKLDYYINGENLIQYDHELDQVARADIGNTPISILTYDGVRLLDNPLMDVVGAGVNKNFFSIFLSTKRNDMEEITGLILNFQRFPVQLAGVERVDAQGNKTDINFSAVKENIEIDDDVFEFTRPRDAFPQMRFQ